MVKQPLPTTYGMRFGVWAAEIGRHLDRIVEWRSSYLCGKDVRSCWHDGFFGRRKDFRIQQKVMDVLAAEFSIPLTPVLIANQVVQRDRHAELINFTGLVAGTIDKIPHKQEFFNAPRLGKCLNRSQKNKWEVPPCLINVTRINQNDFAH